MKRHAGMVGSSIVAVVALAAVQPEPGDGWTREFGVEAGELCFDRPKSIFQPGAR